MGMLDLFKANENKKLMEENSRLKQLLTPEQEHLFNLEEETLKLKEEVAALEQQKSSLLASVENLDKSIREKEKDLIQLDDEILYQSFSLYKPLFDFANSDQYKQKLEEIRNQQKQMIKDKSAVSYFDGWTVDGSKVKGRQMTNDNIKQILRSFNTECDNIVDKVKFNNIDNMKERLRKSYDTLNKLNSTNRISITNTYFQLKLDELSLAYEYQKKKQEEKEEQKRIRAELREQAIVQKELEEARKNTLKDKEHFEKALAKIISQLELESIEENREVLVDKKLQLEKTLNDINQKLSDIDYRQNNQKAGYVYIISNLGSFGENVYKIGMTRRLEPEERIDELSDASVPFNFDIHAMIFTEDAPKLESALHKAFENKKVNMVNLRREFFNVTLDEIKKVVQENFDKTVEFIDTPSAEQYRESQKIIASINQNNN